MDAPFQDLIKYVQVVLQCHGRFQCGQLLVFETSKRLCKNIMQVKKQKKKLSNLVELWKIDNFIKRRPPWAAILVPWKVYTLSKQK